MKTKAILIPSPVFPNMKTGSATLTATSIEAVKENFEIVENKIRQVETVEFLRANGVEVPEFSTGFWDGSSTNVAVAARIRPTQGDKPEQVTELEIAIFTYYEAETQEHWE